MSHLMIDIETASNTVNSAILSIGAVVFNPIDRSITEEFYTLVDLEDCVKRGLEIGASTFKWWLMQSDQSRLEIAQPSNKSLVEALSQLSVFYKENNIESVWFKGSDFDGAILRNAFHKAGLNLPWNFRDARCLRTLIHISNGENLELSRGDDSHLAIHDAIHQAKWVINIIDYIRGSKNFACNITIK